MIDSCPSFNGIDLNNIFTPNINVSGQINLRNTLRWINKNIIYIHDDIRWGTIDLWQKSPLTLSIMTGDCEDTSILAMDVLSRTVNAKRMVIGTFKGDGHAWIESYEGGIWLLGETTNGTIRPVWLSRIIGYEPYLYIYPNIGCELIRNIN